MKQLSIPEFIQKTITEIESSLPEGYAIDESIHFEISITTTETSTGGVDLKVVAGKIDENKEIVQKLSFSIVNSLQRETELKKSGDVVVSYFVKGIKELVNISKPKHEKENNAQLDNNSSEDVNQIAMKGNSL